MLPLCAASNFSNVTMANIKFDSQINSAHGGRSNFSNIRISKFSNRGWRKHSGTAFSASFFIHILGVFFCCSGTQMIWIRAKRLIARMKNKKTVWNLFFIKRLPSPTMNITTQFAFATTVNSISTISCAKPNPASVWMFVNFCKEFIFSHYNCVQCKGEQTQCR